MPATLVATLAATLVAESLGVWLTTALAEFERITFYLACLQCGLAFLLVRRNPCRPTPEIVGLILPNCHAPQAHDCI